MCLSLAIEALTQAFDSHQPHAFSLRGFSFQSPLPSIKPDEIIELQTCIQPLPSRGGQEQTYLVGIESVSDGQWTTHCEGTAIVSTQLDQNGLIEQTNGSNPEGLTKNYNHTTTLDKITREDSDPYQLHPLTIFECLQHALACPGLVKHQNGGGGDSKPGSTVGLKVTELEEFTVRRREEQASGDWTVDASDRSVTPGDGVAGVDVDLKDGTGAVACTIRGLRVTRCDETHEAFDADVPPPEPKRRVPPFLRPLLG